MPASWLSVIGAMLLTVSAVFLQHGKSQASVLIDYFITFILVWKFSVIITDFQTIIQQPLALLYFNGGLVGIILGMIVVSFQIFQKHHSLHKIKFSLVQAVGYMVSFYSINMVILNKNEILSELVTIVVFTLLILFIWFSPYFSMVTSIAILSAVVFFTSFYQPLGVFQTTPFWVVGTLGILYLEHKLHIMKVEKQS